MIQSVVYCSVNAKCDKIWKKYYFHKCLLSTCYGQSVLLSRGKFNEEIRKGLCLSIYFLLGNTSKIKIA